MSAVDQHEPFAAVAGVPAALSVTCPVCDEVVRHFEFDELAENACGDWWSVADEFRFNHCEGCGAFVDYGAVGFTLRANLRSGSRFIEPV